ncbi:transmembrane amino acid transporter protein-domain-containing protein [Truncatella angustata]|uniref:Transmembrane amino acid transporter protein-domain-containing protein n=1 Tax=Truncatella angustata TaxID=152316 RepID=A0A9P8ZX76_9PEZI|nr:transmembrane amino acid transporter protein-domain-containing protein [Truncatella angustata]KAH6654527.1 transmembrane amino acid transporter protein-domain-containing protein [Truncatella angustata]
MASEKKTPVSVGEDTIQPSGAWSSNDILEGELKKGGEANEVFKQTEDGVNFRTVSWQRATVIFFKINFAMSILAVPGALGTLGAVGGSLSIVGWEALNTYTALLLGDFRNRHPECHTLADACAILWGPVGREVCGIAILLAQILVTAAGIVSTDTAFNALSNHGACTVVFAFVSAALITLFSSIRTFSKLGWLTWAGSITFFIAVFIFAVAVTQQDRPAAAPQTGDFDLGYTALAYPTFAAGMTASANLFLFGSGASMYLPVMAEMRRPQDYRKACYVNGALVGACYLTFSLLIYGYCGSWITTPAFGSAGPLFKKISYGVALPGLVVGNGIYQHVAAKYLFVRVLRTSRHLQADTLVHWAAWLGINLVLGALAFVISQAVPILNYLLGLAGSLFFAPFALILPVLFWMHDFRWSGALSGRDKALWGLHSLIVAIGSFLVVGGTYGVALSIQQAFASDLISKVFDCADNSGTVS